MTLTRRGRWTVAGMTVVVVAAAAIGFFVISGKAPAVIRSVVDGVTGRTPPPVCPLTGRPAPGGAIPDRPALAIKVENLPEARPQAGLANADIVYEEPVEGGITRFIAIFQCRDSDRVGPVRSGRTTDAGVLVQYGKPLLGYAGAAGPVQRAIREAGLIDVNYLVAAGAYIRDPIRAEPHNLYTATKKLYAAGRAKAGPPAPAFNYSQDLPSKSRPVSTVHLNFSSYSDVYWKWDPSTGRWLRFHGTVAHMLESGVQVSAVNVVVQVVKVAPGRIVDAAGNPSPEVTLTGSGKAYVFRDGRMIAGTWRRPLLSDLTKFVAPSGEVIPLAPGNTWVELLPSTISVQTSK